MDSNTIKIILLITFLFIEFLVVYTYCKRLQKIDNNYNYQQLNIELSNYLDENIEINIDEEITNQEATSLIDEKAFYTIL